jgi:hypothetical protein
MWNLFQASLHVFFIFFPSSLLANSHILRSVHEMITYTPCARDIWWTLDFASAFLYPGVNSRAELVPSPRAYTWNGAVGSGIIYIKIFETNVVLTYVYSEHSTDKIFLALLYHIIQR